MRKLTILLGMFAAALTAAPTIASGTTAQPVESKRKICAAETIAVERDMGIPRGLLGAISLAETGRWDADREASFAWPWTVMAEGRGRYFDTKAEAVAEVEALLARGITNIDVGCMQINLYYHGGAFADIEEALDPSANATYAGEYLKNLYGSAGSWTTAAGYYHSMTPERGDAYREKVLALWDGAKRHIPSARPARDRQVPEGRIARSNRSARSNEPRLDEPRPAPRAVVSLDMARTAKLNARLRLARAAQRRVTFDQQRRGDLAFWREARAANLGTGHLAAARRAQAAAARQREFDDMGPTRSERFEKRRRNQLKRWRRSAGSTDPSS